MGAAPNGFTFLVAAVAAVAFVAVLELVPRAWQRVKGTRTTAAVTRPPQGDWTTSYDPDLTGQQSDWQMRNTTNQQSEGQR